MKSNDFKIVFFGTSDFAKVILSHLYDANLNVVAVVTRPDKPTGRNLKLQPSIVKQFSLIEKPSIPVLDPPKCSTPEFEKILKEYEPDLFIVAAYGEIIKPNILAIPKTGSINVHPSDLPKYRGASPLQSALFNGDEESAVCIIDVAEKMDAGEIFGRKPFKIEPAENFTALQQKALAISKPLLLEVIEQKRQGTAKGTPQNEELVSSCKKIHPEDQKINWNDSLKKIHNQIRALSDKPGAWCHIQIGDDVKRVKIFETLLLDLDDQKHSPKEVAVSKDSHKLVIKALQIEGKKRLSDQEFLAGARGVYKFF